MNTSIENINTDKMASSNAQKDPEQQQQMDNDQNRLQNYLYIDVRMKRHPELQPYVPSDRDRVLVGNNRRPGLGGGGSNTSAKAYKTPKVNGIATNTNDAKTAKSKKCVSMTRLDQLAQPKKTFPRNTAQQATSSVPSTSLSSSDATSTTTSSLTSNKNYQPPKISANRRSKPSSPPKTIRRPSNEFSQRKSLDESKSSFVSAIEDETVRLNINGDIKPSLNEDQLIRLDEDSRVNGSDDSKARQERDRKLEDEKEARMRAEEEIRMEAEEETRKKAEEETRKKAEEEARKKAEEEARMRAEEEAKLKAEEELRERARLDEKERQSRQEIVDNILKKFNNSETNVDV